MRAVHYRARARRPEVVRVVKRYVTLHYHNANDRRL